MGECDGCGIDLHHDGAPGCGLHEWCLSCFHDGDLRCRACERIRAEVNRVDEDAWRGGER